MENEETVAMDPRRSGGPDREELIAAIRAAVAAKGGTRLTRKAFLERANFTLWDMERHFTCWNGALKAAGFDFDPFGEKSDAERLLADWGRVARLLKRAPQYKAYDIHGKYSGSTLQRRFGTWNNVARAFEAFAFGKEEWADVLALCPEFLSTMGTKPRHRERPSRWARKSRRRFAAKAASAVAPPAPFAMAPQFAVKPPYMHQSAPISAPAPRLEDRPVCGNPINLPAMRNAPTNEMGVVILFAILAERLGFSIESARTGFPDCIAKRRVGPGQWQTVRIEFEYDSRNFQAHGHDPEGCDLIICWVHNWEECPAHIEVIELSKLVL